MYPSTINPNDTFFRTSSFNENPNPTQNDPPFFPEFSSHFLDDKYDNHLFFDQLTERNANMVPPTNMAITNTNTEISSGKIANKSMPLEVVIVPEKRSKRKTSQQRRTGKKDRHSKIYTAQGLRDRRMRLSLQIARKFFDLQDMLGFDKASKTIEWLFTKSKKAIKEVTLKHPQMKNNFYNREEKKESATSECEVESVIENDYGENGKAQKVVYDPVAREMRDKARARARERTREKMMIKSKLWQEPNINPFVSSKPSNLDELGYYSSPFETGDQESSSRSQEKNSPYEASSQSISTQFCNVEMLEKYLGGTSNSSMMFDYQNVGGFDPNNYFLGFLGSWEMDSERINSNNYCGLMTNMAPLTGNFHEQNPSLLFTANSNIHSQEK